MAEHFEAAARQDVPKPLGSSDFISSTAGGANSGWEKLSGLVKEGLSGADKLVNSAFGNLTLVDGGDGHSAVPTDDFGREMMAKKVPPELDPRIDHSTKRPPEHNPSGDPTTRPPERIPPEGPIHLPTEPPPSSGPIHRPEQPPIIYDGF